MLQAIKKLNNKLDKLASMSSSFWIKKRHMEPLFFELILPRAYLYVQKKKKRRKKSFKNSNFHISSYKYKEENYSYNLPLNRNLKRIPISF